MSRNFLTGLNLNKNELLNAAIQSLATAPSNPVIGQIYFDTAMNHMRQWDGTQWLEYLTAESGAGYITSVGSNLSVTDQQLDLGANVVITDAAQVLTNKTINDELYFTNPSTFPNDGGIKINDANENLEIKAYTAALIIESTNDNVEIYANNGIATVNEDEIATVSATQTLSNKTISGAIVTGTTSFRDGSNTEYVNIQQSYTGTTRITSVDDIAIRSTGGDVILYPGNDDGGTGRAYVHWGNDATGAGAGNEIATLGATQTFTNKTIGDGLVFSDGTNASSSIYIDGADLHVEGGTDLYLSSPTANVIIGADGAVYLGGAASGNEIVSASNSLTLTNKALGTNVYLAGDLDADGYKVVNLATPTADGDAATKGYVDANSQGLSVKGSVRVATSDNIADLADIAVIDGVTLANGDRVLLKGQSTAVENGIYVFTLSTTTLARATDQPTVDKGDYTLVVEGTYAATGWVASSATVWTQFSAANEYTAGNGIGISGNAISVALDGGSLFVSGSGLRAQVAEGGGLNIDSTYGLYAQLGDGLITDSMSGDIVFDTANGYGVRKFTDGNPELTPTSGSVTWVVNHNLGSRDVTVQVYSFDDYTQVEVDVVRTDNSNVTLSWNASAIVAEFAYRVVVVG